MSPGVSGTGYARGKLILVGEHAVVYGHPAIAFAIDRGVEVRLTPTTGPTRADGFEDGRLTRALRTVLPAEGVLVSLRSEIPVGRGMGSSAALATALVRASAQRSGQSLSTAELGSRVFALEQIFHGTPSGIDQAVCALGGTIRFVRGAPPTMESLPTPPWKIVVLDTGVCGNTFEMVRKVADQVPNVTPILAEIGSLVDEAAASLDQPSILGPLLTRNHELLARLGVSTPALDACVSFALENGCYGAKLSGAGGGGVVIALTERPDQLVEEALAQGLSAFTCAPARPRAAPQ